jgi:hypothetical protein
MAQQTAVDWLQGEIEYNLFMYPANTDWLPILVDKAKEMEKEQIIDAYKSDRYPCSDADAEEYYNRTYKTHNT